MSEALSYVRIISQDEARNGQVGFIKDRDDGEFVLYLIQFPDGERERFFSDQLVFISQDEWQRAVNQDR